MLRPLRGPPSGCPSAPEAIWRVVHQVLNQVSPKIIQSASCMCCIALTQSVSIARIYGQPRNNGRDSATSRRKLMWHSLGRCWHGHVLQFSVLQSRASMVQKREKSNLLAAGRKSPTICTRACERFPLGKTVGGFQSIASKRLVRLLRLRKNWTLGSGAHQCRCLTLWPN
jgi:hypothetical protein